MSTFCDLALNDFGYIPAETARAQAVNTASIIRQVAAGAIAVDNANRLVQNYKKQRDIQDRMLTISEEQQQHLQTVFWPRDEQFLQEFSNPEAIEAVETMGRRYAGRLIATIAAGFAAKLREARCSAPRYCTSAVTKGLQDLLMARGMAMANARVLGRNIAFAEYQARTDTNIERRMQAVAIGRGLMQDAATLYASAGQGLAAAGGILSSQLNSALESFSYARNFREDLRLNAYDAARQSQQTRAGGQAANQAFDAQGRPLGTGLQDRFGYDSSMKGTYDTEASRTFKADNASALIEPNGTLFPDMQAQSMNDGAIGA